MDLVRDLISLGRFAREESKIKVRQPISEILIDGNNEDLISDLVPLIEEELNVKNVIFTKELNKYMNFIIKPNFKEVGKLFGSKIKLFSEVLLNLSEEEITKLNNKENININLDGEEIEVTNEMVDIRIESKEGFNVTSDTNNFIILNTELSKELILEGLAREIVSKVQNIRKNKDFDIIDRIKIYYSCGEEVKESVNSYIDFIKKETLAEVIEIKENLNETYDINGHEVYLEVEKI